MFDEFLTRICTLFEIVYCLLGFKPTNQSLKLRLGGSRYLDIHPLALMPNYIASVGPTSRRLSTLQISLAQLPHHHHNNDVPTRTPFVLTAE